MRPSESGVGRAKAIFAIVFLLAVAYCGWKIIPVYVNNYEFNDDIRQLAIQSTVDRSSAEAVQNKILAYAKDLGLPVKRENVTVQVGNKVSISVDYTVPIDLKVYIWMKEFVDSAENNQI